MEKNFNEYDEYESRWGFYVKSEILNGRVAMIALILILLFEAFTKQTLLNLVSLFFFF
uniref:CAB/ELIP/HLIP superfamily protein n=1 Tax=Pleurocladia lacustris TaxID=246121 RepID=A0A1I9LW12_9PHAE|nr:hypothetical protein [Pleurocladia lacustris]ANS57638.1 hypothetical protein [Pleurocladia lacustris]ANS57782.1 hypothetical protein [Pleurocladia lacustris]